MVIDNFKIPDDYCTPLLGVIVILEINRDGVPYFHHGSRAEKITSGVEGAIKPENDRVTVPIDGDEFPLPNLEGTAFNLLTLNWGSFGMRHLQ